MRQRPAKDPITEAARRSSRLQRGDRAAADHFARGPQTDADKGANRTGYHRPDGSGADETDARSNLFHAIRGDATLCQENFGADLSCVDGEQRRANRLEQRFAGQLSGTLGELRGYHSTAQGGDLAVNPRHLAAVRPTCLAPRREVFAVPPHQAIARRIDAAQRPSDHRIGVIRDGRWEVMHHTIARELREADPRHSAGRAGPMDHGPVADIDPMVRVSTMGNVDVISFCHGREYAERTGGIVYRLALAVAKFCSRRPRM